MDSKNHSIDNFTRKVYGGMVYGTATIEGGPMSGVSLAAGEHVSHAHIAVSYELATQHAIADAVKPGMPVIPGSPRNHDR